MTPERVEFLKERLTTRIRSLEIHEKSTLSQKEKTALYQAIESNKLSTIREDYKKLYDHITTTVKVRTPREDIYKNDGSFIMPQDQKRWENIVGAFEALVEEKNLRTP